MVTSGEGLPSEGSGNIVELIDVRRVEKFLRTREEG